MPHETSTPEPCCPEFDAAPWDGKTHTWQEKSFIKGALPLFFHIPLATDDRQAPRAHLRDRVRTD